MKPKQGIYPALLAILGALVLTSTAARAETIDLKLSQSTVSTSPGQTISFSATISAASTNSAPVNLVSDSANVDSPLTLDDSPFITSFPLFLNPGDSFTGVLFDVTVPSTAALGPYNGFFDILGGADSSSQDLLATVPFRVEVTPEPSSLGLALLGVGVFGLGMAARGRCLAISGEQR
jgi:hypothetical protein